MKKILVYLFLIQLFIYLTKKNQIRKLNDDYEIKLTIEGSGRQKVLSFCTQSDTIKAQSECVFTNGKNAFSTLAFALCLVRDCVVAIGALRFSWRGFGCATFYFGMQRL